MKAKHTHVRTQQEIPSQEFLDQGHNGTIVQSYLQIFANLVSLDISNDLSSNHTYGSKTMVYTAVHCNLLAGEGGSRV